jgi:hypothetical protein
MDDEEESKSNLEIEACNISEEGISTKSIPSMIPKRKIMSTLNSSTFSND